MLKKVKNLEDVATEMKFQDFKSDDAIDKIAEFWKKGICTWYQLKKILIKCVESEAVDEVKHLEQYNRESMYDV